MPRQGLSPSYHPCWTRADTIPRSWKAMGFMIISFGIMWASFPLKFLLIYQGINLDAGHDADDIIIINSVSQAWFSGLPIVKTVLDPILHHEGDRIRLHPLVTILQVRAEVDSFWLSLKELARHKEYALFAHILYLSGVNNLEQGLFL